MQVRNPAVTDCDDLPGWRIRLTCWGDFAVVDAAGTSIKPRGRKSRALLAYLALHPGKSVSRERLSGLLWGDRPDDQARASLRQAIFELKPFATEGVLVAERDHLRLDAERLTSDLQVMQSAAADGDYRTLLAALPGSGEHLLANLDGIDESFDEWLRIERVRQREALLALVSIATADAFAKGDRSSGRALLARQRELDPQAATPTTAAAAPIAAPAPEPRHAPAARPDGDRQRWRVAMLVAILLTACVVAVGAWQLVPRDSGQPGTIAVLPFRNLSDRSGDAFAAGLSEEISAQLARQPGLRVARRADAPGEEKGANLAEIGQRLGVRYVLDGSVRSAGGKVRVTVALAEVSNGLQLWADTFDGPLEDVFAIQAEIGAQVAARLQRRLAGSAMPSLAGASDGQVYTAYLTARALIRERNLRAMLLAKEQLEGALAKDPNFAPAWSSLAQVKTWQGTLPGITSVQAREQALADARRALRLSPDLAEAHGVLGMILGFGDPEGQRHIKRAAALDPNNAEFLFWLGAVHWSEADFARTRAVYRKAFAIDPLWIVAHEHSAQAWGMGLRTEAIEHVRRVEREGSRYDAHLARGFLSTYTGDFSQAVEQFRAARAATSDVGKQARAAYARMNLLFNLGFLAEARHEYLTCRVAWYKEQKQPFDLPAGHVAHQRLAEGKLPGTTEFKALSLAGDWYSSVLIRETSERLIASGRAHEVVALYDSKDGLLGFSRRSPAPPPAATLDNAPVIASALIAVGRQQEARRLIDHAERLVEEALRRADGRTPAPFDAQAAQVWALAGKHDRAVAALDKARRNGWFNAEFNVGDLAEDVADEPAFASLKSDPRFQAIRARINAHQQAERSEVAAALAAKTRSRTI